MAGQARSRVLWCRLVKSNPVDDPSMVREFFTVDLRGLRAALTARAAEAGMTESDLLRSTWAVALRDRAGARRRRRQATPMALARSDT